EDRRVVSADVAGEEQRFLLTLLVVFDHHISRAEDVTGVEKREGKSFGAIFVDDRPLAVLDAAQLLEHIMHIDATKERLDLFFARLSRTLVEVLRVFFLDLAGGFEHDARDLRRRRSGLNRPLISGL